MKKLLLSSFYSQAFSFGLTLVVAFCSFYLFQSFPYSQKIIINDKEIYEFTKNPKNFVIIVNPVRPRYLWVDESTVILKKHIGQIKSSGLKSTWLLSYDNLYDEELISIFAQLEGEIGALMEVSPRLARDAAVNYISDEGDYYFPNKVFLSAYAISDRDKIIETYFKKFRTVFGKFPISAGAWYIDAHSQKKLSTFGVSSALTVSDQFDTDSLSVWGKYLSFPFYPSSYNSIEPAKYLNNKIPIVNIQWAQRDPIESYGKKVSFSRQSLQANDYINNGYDSTYFSKLLNIYLNNTNTDFNQVTIGLEIGQESYTFEEEFTRQLKELASLQKNQRLTSVTMGDFADFYINKYPNLSPPHFLQKENSFWFMNKNFRVYITEEGNNYFIQDLRYYNNNAYSDLLYADNSQFLQKRVNSLVDHLLLNNKISIGSAQNIRLKSTDSELNIYLDNKLVKITNNGVKDEKGFVLKNKQASQSRVKILALQLTKKITDRIEAILSVFKYSKLENETILGVMVNKNKFLGLKGKEIGLYSFDFAASSNFISPANLIKKWQPW